MEGRLKCRFFATEAEREQFIDEFQEQLSQNGTSLLLGFDPVKMRRWQEASRLAPDADPVEVMRFWLASNRPNLTPKPFAEAIPAYLKYLEAMEREPAYRKHVEAHLRDFADNVGNCNVHEVTHQMIAEYILSMPYKPVTKRHYKRSIGGAYAWWIEQGWAMDNPAKKVRTPEVVTPEPGILTVEETEALFRANEKVDPEICGLLALGAFAGIRASAISKIDYDEIDFTQRGIHTPAEKTKKRRRQWIEGLPDNLWEWLERTPSSAFELTHRQFMHRRSEALKRAGLLIEADDIAYENRKREERREPRVKWKPKCPPKNCFRHSFATYHVALHRDAGKTALIMSHRNQQILFQHYLGIATKEQAERYFQICPSNRTRKC
jgi:integrase